MSNVADARVYRGHLYRKSKEYSEFAFRSSAKRSLEESFEAALMIEAFDLKDGPWIATQFYVLPVRQNEHRLGTYVKELVGKLVKKRDPRWKGVEEFSFFAISIPEARAFDIDLDSNCLDFNGSNPFDRIMTRKTMMAWGLTSMGVTT